MNGYGRGEDNRSKETASVVTRETFGMTLLLFSVVLLVFSIFGSYLLGEIGVAITAFLLGALGYFLYPFLCLCVYTSLVMITGKKFLSGKWVLRTVLVVMSTFMIIHLATSAQFFGEGFGAYIGGCWRAAETTASGATGGGVIFGLIAYPARQYLTAPGAYILFSLLLAGAVIYLLFATPARKLFVRRERFARAARKKQEQAENRLSMEDLPARTSGREGKPLSTDEMARKGRTNEPNPASLTEQARSSGQYSSFNGQNMPTEAKRGQSVSPEGQNYGLSQDRYRPQGQDPRYGQNMNSQGQDPRFGQNMNLQGQDPRYRQGTDPYPDARRNAGIQGQGRGASGEQWERQPQRPTYSALTNQYPNYNRSSERAYPQSLFEGGERAERTEPKQDEKIDYYARYGLQPKEPEPFKEIDGRQILFAPDPVRDYWSNPAYNGDRYYNNRVRKSSVQPVDSGERTVERPSPREYKAPTTDLPNYSEGYRSQAEQSRAPMQRKVVEIKPDTRDSGSGYTVRQEDLNYPQRPSYRSLRDERERELEKDDFSERPVSNERDSLRERESADELLRFPESETSKREFGSDSQSVKPRDDRATMRDLFSDRGRRDSDSRDLFEDTSRDRSRDLFEDTSRDRSRDLFEDTSRDRSRDLFEDTSRDRSRDLFEDTSRDRSRDLFEDTSRDRSRDLFEDTSRDRSRDLFEDTSRDRSRDLFEDTSRERDDLFPEDGRSQKNWEGSVPEEDAGERMRVGFGGEDAGESRVVDGLRSKSELFDSDEPLEEPLIDRETKRSSRSVTKRPLEHIYRPYQQPSLGLFRQYDDTVSVSSEEVNRNTDIIIDTLGGFRVDAEIVRVTSGPSVTRYDIDIPKNISVSTVTKRSGEIAMRLHARDGVNMYANNKSGTISIEVPNSVRATVGLASVMQSEDYLSDKEGALMFAIGKDIEGRNICGNIAKMKHILVAGATGSGKSVCLNAMLISLISKYSPEDLRLILIDPKKVEFTIYDGLPHLMINEIIADAQKAIMALNWSIKEMERRYGLFEEKTRSGIVVRDLDEYNNNLVEGEQKLPKIVIVVDELADLMSVAKKDIEERIQRLAQKARAAGLHLVIATQRPSVDVITGVIKGNLPTRMAFRVIQEVDSRTILDESGAEKLLGNGDMLYKSEGMFHCERVQGAFLSSEEVQAIVNDIKTNNEAYFDPEVSDYINRTEEEESGGGAEDEGERSGGKSGEENSLYIKSLAMVVKLGSASISLIQRRCGVGYNHAGKIMEWMEEKGYVSPFDGKAKARTVLLTKEEFESRYGPLD